MTGFLPIAPKVGSVSHFLNSWSQMTHFMHSFTHSLNQFLLSFCCISGTGLIIEFTMVKQNSCILFPCGANFL
jgi:hypothetical protein